MLTVALPEQPNGISILWSIAADELAEATAPQRPLSFPSTVFDDVDINSDSRGSATSLDFEPIAGPDGIVSTTFPTYRLQTIGCVFAEGKGDQRPTAGPNREASVPSGRYRQGIPERATAAALLGCIRQVTS
jgi:hypothetical protein